MDGMGELFWLAYWVFFCGLVVDGWMDGILNIS